MNGFDIVFWYWWVLAIGFLTLELIVSGFFFLWLAVSAFVVGAMLLLVAAMGVDVQLLLFSLLAVALLLFCRRYSHRLQSPLSDHPLLNRRAEQYIGRTFDLIEPITNGQGKINADGTLWKVEGADCPVGAKVRVVAVRDTVFVVDKCETGE